MSLLAGAASTSLLLLLLSLSWRVLIRVKDFDIMNGSSWKWLFHELSVPMHDYDEAQDTCRLAQHPKTIWRRILKKNIATKIKRKQSPERIHFSVSFLDFPMNGNSSSSSSFFIVYPFTQKVTQHHRRHVHSIIGRQQQQHFRMKTFQSCNICRRVTEVIASAALSQASQPVSQSFVCHYRQHIHEVHHHHWKFPRMNFSDDEGKSNVRDKI